MSKRNNEVSFIKNVFYAIFAQIISLLASLVVSFIAPKLIDVSNYAFWQLFLFYVTYINISRLGLLDGLYLRLGGKKYEELEHKKLGMQWLLFVIFQIVLASIIFTIILLSNIEPNRKFVFGMCCLCMVLINSNNFFSYILEAVNQTRRYSVSVIIQNLTWFLAVAVIVIFQIYSFKVIVICYILGHILAGLYLLRYTKEIWQVKKYPIKEALNDMKKSITCGIFLMISLYAGNLIIGSARMIIDGAWGVETFGYFSFSLTLANFFLTFINQVSMVMFPTLKRFKNSQQIETYEIVREALGIILPLVLFGYLPICLLITWWLPQYIPSLKYLAFFLPICTFDGKMQMLCSTYFKVLRKEKLLMIINVMTMILSAILAVVGCYIVNNIHFVAFSILFVIAARSIVSEIFLAKFMNKKIIHKIFMELILVALFLVFTLNFSSYISTILYLIAYCIYVYINKNAIKTIFSTIKKKRKKEIV